MYMKVNTFRRESQWKFIMIQFFASNKWKVSKVPNSDWVIKSVSYYYFLFLSIPTVFVFDKTFLFVVLFLSPAVNLEDVPSLIVLLYSLWRCFKALHCCYSLFQIKSFIILHVWSKLNPSFNMWINSYPA